MSAPRSGIGVLLVDDHSVVRMGYRALLDGERGIEVLGEAGDAAEAYRQFLALAPDVVVMDVALPDASGLLALERIVARDNAARVLMCSMHADTVFVEQALAGGARGYVTKQCDPQELVVAIRAVARGERYIEHALAQELALQKAAGATAGPFDTLSPREFEIARLLAAGHSSAEIGRRLALSPKTVANRASAIRARLGVASNAELARLAIRHGVLDP